MSLIGYYNELGYRIVNLSSNEEIYQAGNAPGDSQVYLAANDARRLPLETIQAYCRSTLEEMCVELHAEEAGPPQYEEMGDDK